MPVNLAANNYELLRAAYTAMDQTYGNVDIMGQPYNVAVGDTLHAIDNASDGTTEPRQQPFQTPEGYVVTAVIDDPAGYGGKFVIYKNEATNTMLVNAMGTNGNGDAMGWYTNVTSYGTDQWRKGDIRDQVFGAMAEDADASTQIVFNGDSKGGMLAQIMAYDFVTERNKGSNGILSNYSSLLSISNDQLAVVAHSPAGIADSLKRELGDSFDPTWSAFQGVAVDYTAFRDVATGKTEAVSMSGGDFLNGFGKIRYWEDSSIPGKPDNLLDFYPWAHRLTEAGWTYLKRTISATDPDNANFGAAVWAPRTTLDVSEMATIGALCAGGSAGMTNIEAQARMGAALLCGLAFSPDAAAISLWKDGWTTEASIGSVVGQLPGARMLLLELTAAALTAINVAKAVEDNFPGVQESVRDVIMAVGESSQAISDFGTNLFGSAQLALNLVRSNLGKEILNLNGEWADAFQAAAESTNSLMSTASNEWASFQSAMDATGAGASEAFLNFAIGLSNDLSAVPVAAVQAFEAAQTAMETLHLQLEDAGNAAGRQFLGFAVGLSKWLDETGQTAAEVLSIPFSLLRDSPWLDIFGLGRPSLDSAKASFSEATFQMSPITLDLDGDGVETIGVRDGAHFDHEGDGFAEQTGWVGRDDGLLVWDRNGDGVIDNGGELFGNRTKLNNGSFAANGFAALLELDSNHDGKVDADDSLFSSLRVWKDDNGDGVSTSSELIELNAAGVQSITTSYSTSYQVDQDGNEHRQIGNLTRLDGTTASAEDVWFKTDHTYSIASTTVVVPDDIAALPNLSGYGFVRDLHQAMAFDPGAELKSLVSQFSMATSIGQREALLESILFKWSGADAYSQDSRGIYIGDARKLYAVEAFLGEKFIQIVHGIDRKSVV